MPKALPFVSDGLCLITSMMIWGQYLARNIPLTALTQVAIMSLITVAGLLCKSKCTAVGIKWYNPAMSYDVGTHIDLSHLNKRVEAVAAVEKKSFPPESVRRLYEVGTQFIFDQTQKKIARRIPVSYA